MSERRDERHSRDVSVATRGRRANLEDPTVLVVMPADSDGVLPPDLQSALAGRATVVVGRTANDLRGLRGAADAILTWRGGNPRPLLQEVGIPPRLQWIHHSGIGVDQFLFPELVQSAVVITNMRGGDWYAMPMAEYVFALMLMFAKRLPEVAANQRGKRWRRLEGAELRHKTLGVVGLGTIGTAVARLGLAFGMHVLATRRDVTVGALDGVTLRPADGIDEVLAAADFVVLSVPRTPETEGLINADRLRVMKPTSVLINVGRGRLIDETAVAGALAARRLGAAALDVFQSEPLEASSRLWTAPNLFVSPHMSAAVQGPSSDEIAGFLENFDRFVRGEPLLRVVNKLGGY